ncbi:MAG: DeoR/GlpR transcriptional regulator [Lachnospiraceae bacterium]|nr:DeoR/GlpR transcriptional regulator [Lachnospiraceae bacterium]
MLAVERKNQIKDLMLEKKSVTVVELAKLFSVTEETVRKDLQQLENEGFLTRTYGGAFIQDGVMNDVDLTLRETAFVSSKEQIANACAGLIHHGDSIFLDASTTATFLAKRIKNMRLTVVTNSLMAIDQLKDSDSIHLICVGGVFSARSRAFNGRATINSLREYYLDKVFMSCRSLSIEHGITDSNEDTAIVRQTLLEHSDSVYLIADRSKFDKTSFVHISGFEKIRGVVSDYEFTPEWKEFLTKEGVEIHQCSV